MRVISGKYKGKKLEGFDIDGTRPTMDRVKESLFGMIQDSIYGSVVLDLFAGSGSLGIEALSNGAKECIFVDSNKDIVQILNRNLEGIPEGKIVRRDYKQAIVDFNQENQSFDIIFLDPPYHEYLISESMRLIGEYQLLKPDGIVVCELEDEDIVTGDFKVWKERSYGDKKIAVYKL